MKLYLVTLPLYRRAAVDDVIELEDAEAERLVRIGAVQLAQGDEPSLSAMAAAIAAATTAEGIVDTWSSPMPAGADLPKVEQVPVESGPEQAAAAAPAQPAPKPANAPRKRAKA